MQLLLGLSLGVLVAYLAYRAGALSVSGAWAAALTGSLIFGLGGLPWAMLLLLFFISSSALSRAFSSRKAAIGDKFSKSSRRDHGQVLANGGLGALLVAIHAYQPEALWPWIAFAGAMAAVNADTWATELGVLSAVPPRLITNGKTVERGTSGGVTLAGYLAVLGGAALIGLGAMLFSQEVPPLLLVGAVLLAGLAGATFDSFLGATAQAIYFCPDCGKETERHPLHRCGTETVQVRGWRWLNNDWVNVACSLAGAGTAVAALLIIRPLLF
jgi:uncharacterized protein (TIGR00297 family)